MKQKLTASVMGLILTFVAAGPVHALHNGQCELTSSSGDSCEFKCDEGTNNGIYRCSGALCNSPQGQNIPRPAGISSCTKKETRHDVTFLDVARKIFGLGGFGAVSDYAIEP